MSSEHVEVLREMKGWRMPPIGGSAYNAALDAAIAALSAPQPPAEAMEAWHSAMNDVGELRANAPDERYASRAARVESWIKANRPEAPSAPVGVEKAARRLLEAYDDDAHPFEAAAAAEELRNALAAQQGGDS